MRCSGESSDLIGHFLRVIVPESGEFVEFKDIPQLGRWQGNEKKGLILSHETVEPAEVSSSF